MHSKEFIKKQVKSFASAITTDQFLELAENENSLIILDEPEVSLHPGAQEELKIFLLEQILIKRLQIIISTHSPKFSEFLPDDAIKLFYQTTSEYLLV